MSKKQLLSEGEIRRFMKYANLGPLTENFLSEMGDTRREGYHMEESLYEEDDMPEEGGEEIPEEPMGMGDEAEMDDMGDEEMDMGGSDVDVSSVVKTALQDLAQKLNDALSGVKGYEPISIDDSGEEMAPAEEPEMDMEEMPPEEEEEEGMEPEEEEGMEPEEEIVSEVARRVMARLSESRKPAPRAAPARKPAPRAAPARRSRAEAINEVTDRIMKRILKGK
jgi:hypothetical protein